LAGLLPLRASIRLVKGAYSEPPEVAFSQKSEVDDNYFALAKEMLAAKQRQPAMRSAFGTHDISLVRRIAEFAASAGMPRPEVEVQMLYGIKSAEQERLAREGYSSKVLVAYGTHWYAWFIRRLAERPANLWFVARNMF
jgi:proline dehydrogenase